MGQFDPLNVAKPIEVGESESVYSTVVNCVSVVETPLVELRRGDTGEPTRNSLGQPSVATDILGNQKRGSLIAGWLQDAAGEDQHAFVADHGVVAALKNGTGGSVGRGVAVKMQLGEDRTFILPEEANDKDVIGVTLSSGESGGFQLIRSVGVTWVNTYESVTSGEDIAVQSLTGLFGQEGSAGIGVYLEDGTGADFIRALLLPGAAPSADLAVVIEVVGSPPVYTLEDVSTGTTITGVPNLRFNTLDTSMHVHYYTWPTLSSSVYILDEGIQRIVQDTQPLPEEWRQGGIWIKDNEVVKGVYKRAYMKLARDDGSNASMVPITISE